MLPAFLSALLLGLIAAPFIAISKRRAKKEHEREKEKYYKDLAARVVYVIKEIEYQPGYIIIATFGSGKKRRFDASEFLQSHPALNPRPSFESGTIVNGSILWPNGTILSAEYVYQHSTPVE